jgi:hypothetical protein
VCVTALHGKQWAIVFAWGRPARLVLLLSGFLVGAVVLGSIFGVDEGEVVTLTTVGPGGARYDTQLWVVERPDGLWLRSASPRSQWLDRLRAEPRVELQRDEAVLYFRALPSDDPALRDDVNRRMAEKYGRADRWLGWIFDRSRSVPIHLEPRERDPAFDPPAGGSPLHG